MKSPLVCEVVYNEELTPELCGRLVVEIVKYFLYYRGQIPQQVDQLKRQRDSLTDEVENRAQHLQTPEGKENKHAKEYARTASQQKMRKQEAYLSKLEQSLNDLEKLFQELHYTVSHTVLTHNLRVALIIGSTVVTPKDAFIVELPRYAATRSDGAPQIKRREIAHMFRTLVTWEDLSLMPAVGLTNTYVMVELPQNSSTTLTQWFTPKPHFDHLERGRQVLIKVSVQKQSEADEEDQDGQMAVQFGDRDDLTSPECYGSKEQRHQLKDDPDKDVCEEAADLDCVSGLSNALSQNHIDDIDSESESQTTVQELMWFQAPIVFKGFQDIALPHSSGDTSWF